MWYSNTILATMNKTGTGISPRIGTILIGVCNFIGSILALYPSGKFGRKTLVLVGHFIMGPVLIMVGVFA